MARILHFLIAVLAVSVEAHKQHCKPKDSPPGPPGYHHSSVPSPGGSHPSPKPQDPRTKVCCQTIDNKRICHKIPRDKKCPPAEYSESSYPSPTGEISTIASSTVSASLSASDASSATVSITPSASVTVSVAPSASGSSTPSASPSPTPGQSTCHNELKNPSFEIPLAPGFVGAGESWHVSLVRFNGVYDNTQSVKRTGARSFHMAAAARGGINVNQYDVVLDINKTYRFSFWAFLPVDETGDGIQYNLRVGESGGRTSTVVTEGVLTQSSGWVKYEGTFTPETWGMQVYVSFFTQSPKEWYLDDVVVTADTDCVDPAPN